MGVYGFVDEDSDPEDEATNLAELPSTYLRTNGNTMQADASYQRSINAEKQEKRDDFDLQDDTDIMVRFESLIAGLSLNDYQNLEFGKSERGTEELRLLFSALPDNQSVEVSTLQESFNQENELAKNQRDINLKSYKQQDRETWSNYIQSKSSRMWQEINSCIEKQREIRRHESELREAQQQRAKKELEEQRKMVEIEKLAEQKEKREEEALLAKKREQEQAREEEVAKQQTTTVSFTPLAASSVVPRPQPGIGTGMLGALNGLSVGSRESARTGMTSSASNESFGLGSLTSSLELDTDTDSSKKVPPITHSVSKGADNKSAQAIATTQNISEANTEKMYYQTLISYIKTDILPPVANSKEVKSYCSTNKRRIKPKLGQLTNSRSQIARILGELDSIFTEAAAYSELAYKWLLNFLSKSVVSQAETETAVSPTSAYPLGTLAIFMMAKHPLLRELLLARIVKKCPYVIGYTCNIDTEAGRVRMGYKKIEERWEDDAMYCERMGGIASVWAVMTQVVFNQSSTINHPYPIYHSWTFVARTLNISTSELTNAHFTVMSSWWDLAGRRFVEAYGNQSHKILTTIWDAWTRSASDKRYPAAARLRILGEQWQSSGVIGIDKPEEP
ncbi:GLE1-like protein-domain-containing protein [Dipodascopsis uninucleata]